ncbi:acetyl esterase/lipase [Novosphingobium sp. PhB55]|uniref:alpha/beta hydrolase n=1 Tax=Novosphingobium sp. PhB55 TaxID=2485106 RepID=UPI001066AD04|nr:alpha/beta hydrolase [Novosphingobium sp. PhB55]TDW59932.1 acetyl esterase/lipase [Novosphingobium sp. PhB55]
MTQFTRRTTLAAAAALTILPRLARAQTSAQDEVVPLWPGAAPGAPAAPIHRKVADQSRDPAKPDRWVTGIDRPVLVVKRPARPNGSAMLIVPGGGYGFLSYDNEGTSQAAWLNARGVTAFILLYRLPGEGWSQREDVPLQDAQRAMRLIRAGASRFGIDPGKVGVLGFSAGGHLAGSLATRHSERVYQPVDQADSQSAAPQVAGLVYPVVSLLAPFTHVGSRDNLLGPGSTPAMQKPRSVEERVDGATCPTFLVHAADDGLVPPANSIALFQALQEAKRASALHIFENGGHGFGVRLPATMQAAAWPSLFASFAATHGVTAA